MDKNKIKFVHINKAPFKTKTHISRFWVVGYNAGGIGSPIYNVDKDVKWFLKKEREETIKAKDAEFKKKIKKLRDWFKKVQTKYEQLLEKAKKQTGTSKRIDEEYIQLEREYKAIIQVIYGISCEFERFFPKEKEFK